jgi:hypothetical protein
MRQSSRGRSSIDLEVVKQVYDSGSSSSIRKFSVVT